MKRNLPILMVAAVAALLAFLFLQTPTPPEPVAALKPLSMPKPQAESRRVLAPTTAPDTINEEVIEEALEPLAPDYRLVQCENAQGVENGLYRLVRKRASSGGSDGAYPTERGVVLDNTLSIHVIDEAGSAVLLRDDQHTARVTWQGDTCSVAATQSVAIRGDLRFTDGEPAAGFEVIGCKAFARTDDDGRWELNVTAGTTCYAMAFVTAEDGSFGKSNVLKIEASAPGPIEGLSLVLPPPEQIWSAELLTQAADQYAVMLEPIIHEQERRLSDARAAIEGCTSPSACGLLEQIAADEQLRLELMREDVELLSDPEQGRYTLMDMFLYPRGV